MGSRGFSTQREGLVWVCSVWLKCVFVGGGGHNLLPNCHLTDEKIHSEEKGGGLIIYIHFTAFIFYVALTSTDRQKHIRGEGGGGVGVGGCQCNFLWNSSDPITHNPSSPPPSPVREYSGRGDADTMWPWRHRCASVSVRLGKVYIFRGGGEKSGPPFSSVWCLSLGDHWLGYTKNTFTSDISGVSRIKGSSI